MEYLKHGQNKGHGLQTIHVEKPLILLLLHLTHNRFFMLSDRKDELITPSFDTVSCSNVELAFSNQNSLSNGNVEVTISDNGEQIG